MNKSELNGFKTDLHVSSTPFIVALVCIGLGTGILGGRPTTVTSSLPIAFACLILAFTTWLLKEHHPDFSSKFLILGLVFTMMIVINQLGVVPQAFSLLIIPPLLSLSLVGTRFALSTGLISILAILALWKFNLGEGDASTLFLSILTLTGTFSIAALMKRNFSYLAHWSYDQYRESLELLGEARDQRTELLQTTKELAHATQQLSLMNEKLAISRHIAEEAQKAKATFVANVSHEFRTPLNMIIGLIDLLMENPEVYGRPLPSALVEDIGIVSRNCEHLSSMINDVLDLSQVEAGRMALQKERVDLLEVVERAVAVVKPLLDKKNLYININVQSELPMVYCDRTRIRQVIVNLFGNAARFTEKGGITVNIWKEEQSIVVRVTDTGPGISPENLNNLFQPFSQVNHDASNLQSSSGLGLAISKQFVELSGGRMWVESTLGVGSSFHFRLPIDLPIESSVWRNFKLVEDWIWYERLEPVKLPLEPLKRHVVLYDSTGDLHPLLARYMDEIEFINTPTIDQAMNECRHQPTHALLLNLPDPLELVKQVETLLPNIPGVPVVGYSFPPKDKNAQLAGAAGYILKPVHRTSLKNCLQIPGKPVKRLLLVDDHLDELILMKRMLMTVDSSLQVEVASSGRESLEKLRQGQFDLLLLDIVMRDMDGWEVLNIKNQDPTIKEIPTIIISGKDPSDVPLASRVVISGSGEGLSLSKAIRCFRALSLIQMQSD